MNNDLFRNLMEQARAVLAFTVQHTVEWDAEDDRDDYLRVADFVAWRNGYTATTTPPIWYVVDAIDEALRRENREPRGGGSRADQAPEFTP